MRGRCGGDAPRLRGASSLRRIFPSPSLDLPFLSPSVGFWAETWQVVVSLQRVGRLAPPAGEVWRGEAPLYFASHLLLLGLNLPGRAEKKQVKTEKASAEGAEPPPHLPRITQ